MKSLFSKPCSNLDKPIKDNIDVTDDSIQDGSDVIKKNSTFTTR